MKRTSIPDLDSNPNSTSTSTSTSDSDMVFNLDIKPGPQSQPQSRSERIANLVLDIFDHRLPLKCKPRVYPDGRREWTPLAAVVLVNEKNCHDENCHEDQLGDGGDDDDSDSKGCVLRGSDDESLLCVSLATGTKCLSSSMIPKCHGQVLHDCHAEILALRGFNSWLLSEARRCLEDDNYHSPYINFCSPSSSSTSSSDGYFPPFELKDRVSIYMFNTTAPCGDASMELLMASKPEEDAVPWSDHNLTDSMSDSHPLGRGHFSRLGIVRRKPARADAEPTMSKSCTDKLALKQITSILSFPADVLFRSKPNNFLRGLVVYADQFHDIGYQRAFGPEGRLRFASKSDTIFFDYLILPERFERRFAFEKDTLTNKSKSTNLSALMVLQADKNSAVIEVLVNGVKQGFKQFDERPGKASIVSRSGMSRQLLQIWQLLEYKKNRRPKKECDIDQGEGEELKYLDLKCMKARSQRLSIKQNTVGRMGEWPTNSSDDDFPIRM